MSSENRTEYGLKCDAQEKHEEIKQKAWEIYRHNWVRNISCRNEPLYAEESWKELGEIAWQGAEYFYKLAKEKEKEREKEIKNEL